MVCAGAFHGPGRVYCQTERAAGCGLEISIRQSQRRNAKTARRRRKGEGSARDPGKGFEGPARAGTGGQEAESRETAGGGRTGTGRQEPGATATIGPGDRRTLESGTTL